MKYVISVKEAIGSDLRTRSFFRRDIVRLMDTHPGEVIFDFKGVEFISRSVADEICNLQLDFPSLSVIGMDGDVEMMYRVVVNGRNSQREFPANDIKVYHLRTIQEMSARLCSL